MAKKYINKPYNHCGFMLVTALLMISLAVMMTSVMFNRTGSYVPYVSTINNKHKAQLIALGGIALVQELLSRPVELEQKEEAEKQQQPKAPSKNQKTQHTIKTLFPILNRWQTFELTQAHDDVDATLSVCVMSEEGKINLNKIFDFDEGNFVGHTKQAAQQPQQQNQTGKVQQAQSKQNQQHNWKEILVPLFERLEKETKTKDLLKSLEQFLQKRGYPLNDVTELLTIKQFEPFKRALYYNPPAQTEDAKNSAKRIYALTDLFTVDSKTATIEPWLLSDSIQGLIGSTQNTKVTEKQRAEIIENLLKNIKAKAKWAQQWDSLLKNLYNVEAKSLPKGFLDGCGSLFASRYFSGLVSCTTGDVTQTLFVILERIEKSQDTKTVYDTSIRKFYWL